MTETNLYEICKALFGDLVNNDNLILFIRNRNFEFCGGLIWIKDYRELMIL